MNNLDRLIADLKSVPPSNRVLVWGGWDVAFPPSYTDFREYLFTSAELLAALTGQPVPPPTTIRVRTTAILNVRSAPVIADNKVGQLAQGASVEVYEIETTAGWRQIAAGEFVGKWVSSQYVEKVT